MMRRKAKPDPYPCQGVMYRNPIAAEVEKATRQAVRREQHLAYRCPRCLSWHVKRVDR